MTRRGMNEVGGEHFRLIADWRISDKPAGEETLEKDVRRYGLTGWPNTPSAGVPANSCLPSASVVFRVVAVGPEKTPALERNPWMVTSTPAGKSVLRQPRRISALGPASSMAQVTTLPSGPLTSKYSHEWGLTHSIR